MGTLSSRRRRRRGWWGVPLPTRGGAWGGGCALTYSLRSTIHTSYPGLTCYNCLTVSPPLRAMVLTQARRWRGLAGIQKRLMPLALALGPLRVTQPTTQQLEGIVNSLLTHKKYNQSVRRTLPLLYCTSDCLHFVLPPGWPYVQACINNAYLPRF